MMAITTSNSIKVNPTAREDRAGRTRSAVWVCLICTMVYLTLRKTNEVSLKVCGSFLSFFVTFATSGSNIIYEPGCMYRVLVPNRQGMLWA